MNEGTENGVKERGALQSKRFIRKEFPNLTRTRFFLCNVHLMCCFLRRARCARRQCERRARRTYGTPYTSVLAMITGNSAFFFPDRASSREELVKTSSGWKHSDGPLSPVVATIGELVRYLSKYPGHLTLTIENSVRF